MKNYDSNKKLYGEKGNYFEVTTRDTPSVPITAPPVVTAVAMPHSAMAILDHRWARNGKATSFVQNIAGNRDVQSIA